MQSLFTLLLGFALVGVDSAPVGAQNGCTAETARSRDLVVRYATGQHGGRGVRKVPIVSASQVTLLTNATNAQMIECATLRHKVAGLRGPAHNPEDWAITFYRVGVHYYVISLPTTPAVQPTGPNTFNVQLRWSPLYIYDHAFNFVAGIGM